MSAKVKDLQLTRTSTHITMEPWGEVPKEEAYFELHTEWLGKPVQATVIASRYLAGMDRNHLEMTAWRWHVAHGAPSDLARQRINEAADPIVRDWLASEAYLESRREAFAHALRHLINAERGDASRVARVFQQHRHELDPAVADRLYKATLLLAELQEYTKS